MILTVNFSLDDKETPTGFVPENRSFEQEILTVFRETIPDVCANLFAKLNNCRDFSRINFDHPSSLLPLNLWGKVKNRRSPSREKRDELLLNENFYLILTDSWPGDTGFTDPNLKHLNSTPMLTQSFFRKMLNMALPAALILYSAGCSLSPTHGGSSRNLDFDGGWLFTESDPQGAEVPGYDDSGWRKVDLPHDWSVEDFAGQDSVHSGPFLRTMENGHDVGYLRGGTAWYRKKFNVPRQERNRQVILSFDGVQSEATLFVNGREVGRHMYGYTPFYFNITPYLNRNDNDEVVAVRVYKPEQNSRWFTGAGIYRPVSLSYLDEVHVEPWGVMITATPRADKTTADLAIQVKLANAGVADAGVTLRAEIFGPDGKKAATAEKVLTVPAGKDKTCDLSASLSDPVLWDTGNPALYTASISVVRNGEIKDTDRTTIGIRSIHYSPKGGLLLNGKPVLLKGACMHHDNGLLGAAAFNRAEARRVSVMKANGYNAIRTSHNPPSKAFLDACDSLGMLVIDEAFDAWMKPKRPNDYHLHFANWWKKDLDAMILRDRNHPSVIIWSIGNEIQERSDSAGLVIARNMIREIHSIDTTRPVTEAVCAFWDNPGKGWDYSANAFSVLDIGGYNYQWQNYEKDHAIYPQRLMMGTESVPREANENWQLVKSEPYVIGDFVWTGLDYLGEAGIGHATWQSDPGFKDPFAMPWPWYVSNCGDIDILGNKKPQSFYRDVVWDQSRLEMAVHEPAPQGMHEVVFFWGWPQECQSWNWSGNEGKPLEVSVYSSYPTVRLELNGKSLGEKEILPSDAFTARFTVPYQSGELKASGISGGQVRETKILQTSGPVAAIVLKPERSRIMADRGEIAYVDVVAVDAGGNLVPDASLPVTVQVSGEGSLLAAGNASPLAEGSLQDNAFTLFRGRGMVIVRSTGKTGNISIEASSEGLRKATGGIEAMSH